MKGKVTYYKILYFREITKEKMKDKNIIVFE